MSAHLTNRFFLFIFGTGTFVLSAPVFALHSGIYITANQNYCSFDIVQTPSSLAVEDGRDCDTSYAYEYSESKNSNSQTVYVRKVNSWIMNVVKPLDERSFFFQVQNMTGAGWEVKQQVLYKLK